MSRNTNIYADIAERTKGDVYIGVVGPVRCGKSTFIQRFMQNFVIDNITNKHDKERAIDELPQASDGNMVMTTKPQFVPSDAVKVKINNTTMSVRLIDSVGFMVKGASGDFDGDKPRYVTTPWSEESIPFARAAQIGTEKVISEHSTFALVLSTDGSFLDLPRESYVSAERLAIEQVKKTGKPYVILLNSAKPQDSETLKLKNEMEKTYDSKVIIADANNLKGEDVENIMTEILKEFPLEVINIKMPKWLKALTEDNVVVKSALDGITNAVGEAVKIGDYNSNTIIFENSEYFEPILSNNVDMGSGAINFEVVAKEGLFYKILSDQCGTSIKDDYELIGCLKTLTQAKQKYDTISQALEQVEQTGYGVVLPTINDMQLKEPELVKQGGRCGIKLTASASSLHIVKVDVETEVNPIIGSYEQSEELLKSLLQDYETNPQGIWQTNIFGKSLESLVGDGLSGKLNSMPEKVQTKLRKTICKIVNDGKNNFFCILI